MVSSPTGSGKTLTAFLSILSELTTLSQKGELEDKVYCIYISPLKALDNDIEKNNDNIERDDGVRILLYLGSFCIYGWEMKDYETDHSNRKT